MTIHLPVSGVAGFAFAPLPGETSGAPQKDGSATFFLQLRDCQEAARSQEGSQQLTLAESPDFEGFQAALGTGGQSRRGDPAAETDEIPTGPETGDEGNAPITALPIIQTVATAQAPKLDATLVGGDAAVKPRIAPAIGSAVPVAELASGQTVATAQGSKYDASLVGSNAAVYPWIAPAAGRTKPVTAVSGGRTATTAQAPKLDASFVGSNAAVDPRGAPVASPTAPVTAVASGQTVPTAQAPKYDALFVGGDAVVDPQSAPIASPTAPVTVVSNGQTVPTAQARKLDASFVGGDAAVDPRSAPEIPAPAASPGSSTPGAMPQTREVSMPEASIRPAALPLRQFAGSWDGAGSSTPAQTASTGSLAVAPGFGAAPTEGAGSGSYTRNERPLQNSAAKPGARLEGSPDREAGGTDVPGWARGSVAAFEPVAISIPTQAVVAPQSTANGADPTQTPVPVISQASAGVSAQFAQTAPPEIALPAAAGAVRAQSAVRAAGPSSAPGANRASSPSRQSQRKATVDTTASAPSSIPAPLAPVPAPGQATAAPPAPADFASGTAARPSDPAPAREASGQPSPSLPSELTAAIRTEETPAAAPDDSIPAPAAAPVQPLSTPTTATTATKESKRSDAEPAPAAASAQGMNRADQWSFREAPPEALSQLSRKAMSTDSAKPAEAVDPSPLVEPAEPKAQIPLKGLSIQLGQAAQERVELRVSQSAGEVRLAVRAADPEVAHSIRQALPDLVSHLEQSGFRAEAWRPGGVVSGPGGPAEVRPNPSEARGGNSQQQHGWSQQNRGQRDQNQGDRPKWVEELEGTLTGGGPSSTGEWNGFSN